MQARADHGETPAHAGTTSERSDAEAAMFRQLVSGENDVAGMVAYALHRRAFLDWSEAFARSAGRDPDDAERRAFLIGESSPRRLSEHRSRAETIVSATGPRRSLAARRTLLWPFGPGIGIPANEPAPPVNWRGLAWKLLLLLIAVVVTALALRLLVVHPS